MLWVDGSGGCEGNVVIADLLHEGGAVPWERIECGFIGKIASKMV